MTEIWTKWENRVVNGVFPLRRFLGRSDHSVVFLTEYKQGNNHNAAIKLVPADPALTEAQLSCWRTAAALSHPHLIKLLDTGRCQLGGHPFLFVVMEYAEQTLAQVLAKRPLTSAEMRELLTPTLATLAYLHGKNLVHGQLKPPNFLVVDDQLKLASDNIHPAGKRGPSTAKRRVYDPPEAQSAGVSAAGDIWGLGVTLVEALTQRVPTWADERSESLSLPPALASDFVDIARQCLNRNPGSRPSLANLEALLKRSPPPPETSAPAPTPLAPGPVVLAPVAPGPVVPAAVVPSAVVPAAVVPAALVPAVTDNSGSPWDLTRRLFAWVIAALLVVSAAVWLGVHHRRPQAAPSAAQYQTPSKAAPMNPQPPAAAPASSPALGVASPSVLHEEIPNASRRARESIHGIIKVTVRVTVDRAGNVVGVALENRGSSKYFARLAREAAAKWRFTAPEQGGPREWLLRFEFTRNGTTGQAAPRR